MDFYKNKFEINILIKNLDEEIIEMDGEVPPGIETSVEVEFNVLRPTGTKKK